MADLSVITVKVNRSWQVSQAKNILPYKTNTLKFCKIWHGREVDLWNVDIDWAIPRNCPHPKTEFPLFSSFKAFAANLQMTPNKILSLSCDRTHRGRTLCFVFSYIGVLSSSTGHIVCSITCKNTFLFFWCRRRLFTLSFILCSQTF